MRLPLVLFAFGSLALLETDDSVSFWHVAPRPGQEKQHDCSPRIWLGWVSSSLFPIETNPNPPKKVFALGRIDPNATLDLVFLGLGLGWGIRWFHNNIYMLSNPTEFGESQTPYIDRNECVGFLHGQHRVKTSCRQGA